MSQFEANDTLGRNNVQIVSCTYEVIIYLLLAEKKVNEISTAHCVYEFGYLFMSNIWASFRWNWIPHVWTVCENNLHYHKWTNLLYTHVNVWILVTMCKNSGDIAQPHLHSFSPNSMVQMDLKGQRQRNSLISLYSTSEPNRTNTLNFPIRLDFFQIIPFRIWHITYVFHSSFQHSISISFPFNPCTQSITLGFGHGAVSSVHFSK